jgi:hypothetical protein
MPEAHAFDGQPPYPQARNHQDGDARPILMDLKVPSYHRSGQTDVQQHEAYAWVVRNHLRRTSPSPAFRIPIARFFRTWPRMRKFFIIDDENLNLHVRVAVISSRHARIAL